MKKIIIIILLFSPVFILAQNRDSTYSVSESNLTGVVYLEGANKTALYNRAKLWVVNEFKSENDVIQLSDNENDKITVKSAQHYFAPPMSPGLIFTGQFTFILTIDILKDNKYKFSFDNIYHEANKGKYSGGSFDNKTAACGSFKLPKNSWYKMKLDCRVLLDQLIKELKIAMMQ